MAKRTFTRRPKGPWSARVRKQQPAAQVAARVLATLGGPDARDSLDVVRLWRHWGDVLGTPLAQMARPLGRRAKGRVLVLGMEDPIVGQELAYFAPQILERVNVFLQRKVFDKIAFELIGSRVPLDEIPPGGPRRGVFKPKRPELLNTSAELTARQDAVGRAYRAYVDHFRARSEGSDAGHTRDIPRDMKETP